MRKVTKLVGAEAERRRLDELLQKRAQFAGFRIDEDDDTSSSSSSSSASSAGRTFNTAEELAAAASEPARAGAVPAVTGFGRELAELYGLGRRYDADRYAAEPLSRFDARVASWQSVPAAVRARGRQWAVGEEIAEDPAKLEARAKRVNRTKLRYAGVSMS